MEEGKCPGEAFLHGELLGIIDKLQFSTPVSKVAASVEGRRVELEIWARRLLGLLKGSGEVVQSLDQLLQLGRRRRGLGHGDIMHRRLDFGRGVLRRGVDLLVVGPVFVLGLLGSVS